MIALGHVSRKKVCTQGNVAVRENRIHESDNNRYQGAHDTGSVSEKRRKQNNALDATNLIVGCIGRVRIVPRSPNSAGEV
jgi:hypothetical protein